MHKHQSHCVVRSDLEISSAGDEITAHAPNGQDWHFLYVTAVWRKKRKEKKKPTSITSIRKAVAQCAACLNLLALSA